MKTRKLLIIKFFFIFSFINKTYEIANRAGWNKRAGQGKKFGFIIQQAKNFASRVAKNLKIVPEHALLLGTRDYFVWTRKQRSLTVKLHNMLRTTIYVPTYLRM